MWEGVCGWGLGWVYVCGVLVGVGVGVCMCFLFCDYCIFVIYYIAQVTLSHLIRMFNSYKLNEKSYVI